MSIEEKIGDYQEKKIGEDQINLKTEKNPEDIGAKQEQPIVCSENIDKELNQETIADIKARIEQKMKDGKMAGEIYDLEKKVGEIFRNREEANKALEIIESLQLKLSKELEIAEENLILENGWITIPSLAKEYDDLEKKRLSASSKLKYRKNKREVYEATKPGLFGKKRWQKTLAELKKDEEIAEKEDEDLKNTDEKKLYDKAHYNIDINSRFLPSLVSAIIRESKAQGRITEIFNELRAELSKVINTNLSPEIMADYARYRTLAGK